MNKKICFCGQNDHIFVNHQFLVVFDGKEYIFSFVEDDAEGDCVDSYQLTSIEDGLYHLVFIKEKRMFTCIIDWMKQAISCSYVDNGIRNVVGSFSLFNEDCKITNLEKAVDFWLRFFNEHDESAIDMYLSEPYLQHNPTVADGIEAFRNEFHPRFLADMKECSTEVKRVVSRDDLVFIHNILKRNPLVKGHAAVDIFRFENGRIVEHWDVIQKMPDTSKNDHPMF